MSDNKGVEFTCQKCHHHQPVQEATELMLYGFKLDEVRRILWRYREQVPHYEGHLARERVYQETGIVMLDFLTRLASSHPDCCPLMREIRQFLHRVNAQSSPPPG